MFDVNEKLEHPDTELLVAFAEKSLTSYERDSVLLHLADCAECREILFLTQDAVPEEKAALVFTPERESRTGWFTWRAIIVAACLLLTVTVLTQMIYKRIHSSNETVAKVRTEPPPTAKSEDKSAMVSNANPAATPAPAVKTPEIKPAPQMPDLKATPAASGTPQKVGPQTVAKGEAKTPIPQSPIPQNYKVVMPARSLIQDEHPLSASEMASIHQLHQAQASDVHSSNEAIRFSASSAPAAQMTEQAVTKPPAEKMRAYDAPSASSGGSANYAPKAATAAHSEMWDRSIYSSQGASANTYAVTRPVSLPSGKPVLDSVEVGGKKLALDQDGRLYTSFDGGANWREIPKQWSGTATMLMIVPKTSAVDASQSSESAGSDSGDTVMLWNAGNAAWISTDGGDTWTPFTRKAKPTTLLDKSAPKQLDQDKAH
jgi:hypothetical protein